MTAAGSLRTLWTRPLGRPLRGLVLAREKSRLLTWDQVDGLYLLDPAGQTEAHVRTPGPLAAACAADDGSAYAAAGSRGELWWLAPDLTTAWAEVLPRRPLVTALDPFGQYLAVADAEGGLHIFDCHGRRVMEIACPRPLHHLAFVPSAPNLVGAADYGLVACVDLSGRWVWREGLVAHVGSLAVSGDGGTIALACFTEGVLRYALSGKKAEPQVVPDGCRLVAISFDGRVSLAATLSGSIRLLDPEEESGAKMDVEQPPIALALGPLGDAAVVALANGVILGLQVDF